MSENINTPVGGNPYDAARSLYSEQQSNISRKNQRDKLLEPKTFERQYYPLYLTAVAAAFAFSLYSGATEFSFFLNTERTGIAFIVSCAFAFVLTALIELPKNYLLYLTFYAFFWEKQFKKLPTVLALAFSAGSTLVAYFGAYNLNKLTTQGYVSQAAVVVNVDSIKNDYDAQIAAIAAEIELVRKQNTRVNGEIRSTAQININTLNKQRDLLVENREQAVAAAKASNTEAVAAAQKADIETRAQHQLAVNQKAELLSILSVLSEVLLVLFSGYIWWYQVQCKYEEIACGDPNRTPPHPNGGSKLKIQQNGYGTTTQAPFFKGAGNKAPQSFLRRKASRNPVVSAWEETPKNSTQNSQKTPVIHSQKTVENTLAGVAQKEQETAANIVDFDIKNPPVLTLIRTHNPQVVYEKPTEEELAKIAQLIAQYKIKITNDDPENLAFECVLVGAKNEEVAKSINAKTNIGTWINTYNKRANDYAEEAKLLSNAGENAKAADKNASALYNAKTALAYKDISEFRTLYAAKLFSEKKAG